MGICILDRLMKAGYTVAAYDPVPACQTRIVERGAMLMGSLAELAAQSGIIVMSLPAGKHVRAAVDGLLPGLGPANIVVDTSTIDPETSRECAALAGAKGARYLDAPVLGRPSTIGNWILPMGGPADAVAEIQEVFHNFVKTAVRVGDHGAGNTFKILNQLMFVVINGISAEVMAITDAIGVDKQTFYEVVAASGAATVSGLFKEVAGRIASSRFDDPTFTLELLCKDAGLGIEMTRNAGIRPTIAGLAYDLTVEASEGGLAKEDTSSLYKAFRAKIARELEQGAVR
jgi:3-hydroxyisobutyrate dehydrogenase-like beta-hydroxyacid dehydrogenase